MDFLSDFIDDLRAKGCAPANVSDIVADDRMRRFQLQGDRRGQKNGRYQFKISGDYAVGWFLNFRDGVTHKFSSRVKREYTAEEKASWKKRVDDERKEQARKIREEQEAAAKKAVRMWDRADKKGATEYLERKQVELNLARIWKGTVCVPVYVDARLVSLQFISPDGAKRFLTGGEFQGGYFSIAKKGDDLSTLVICEGFATGGSIRKATGYPVVIAFNAGNLKPVAQAMRKKYPTSRIVIACDSDQWTFDEKKKPAGINRDEVTGDDPRWTIWREEGRLVNPGREKAEQAAVAIGGAEVIWPAVRPDDAGKRTDFNDVATTDGLEAVEKRITGALARKEERAPKHGGARVSDSSVEVDVQTGPSSPTHATSIEDEHDMPPAPPIDAYDDILPSVRSLTTDTEWKELLLTNAEGKLKTGSLRNTMLFLKFHPDFRGTFAYNEFHQNIMVVRCPPWAREADFNAERLSDVTITNAAAELEKYGLTPSTDKAFKAIQSVAHEANFHPAREYFNALTWDDRPRLHNWLAYYMGCEQEDPDYLAFVGTKWMVAAVKRVFVPGCKFDHVLVIEGEQGAGKSTMLKELATFGREKQEAYFTDAVTIADIQNKDTIMKIQGSIIVELSELSGFSKKDDEEIKRWVTLQHDDVRLPYGRETSRFSRQFILAATTNLTSYLKDPSGNRRYWPVLAGKIDMQALKEDREQLWAEAVHHYRQGMYIGPTREEEALANIERAKRLAHDVWTDTVLRHADDRWKLMTLGGHSGFKVDAIMGDMGMILRDRDDRSMRRISGILQLGGYENKPVWNRDSGKTERFWMKKAGA